MATKKRPDRFQVIVPPGPLQGHLQALRTTPHAQLCALIDEVLNKRLRESCAKKTFEEAQGTCAAGGGAGAPVDLIVLIDVSGSMQDEANDLSLAADAAIQAAAQKCPSDLRVVWLGIEGIWGGTKFTQSYRDYLHGLGVSDASMVGTPGDLEDGAAAVIDLVRHFDWRSGAAKAIFYLGDEALEGGDPQAADDVAAADAAIAAATAGAVTVFTYFGTAPSNNATTATEYARLATSTGGQAFTAPVANVGGFQAVLERIICASGGGGGCHPLELPSAVPCIRVRWGDGPKDKIETNDTEILCITVCNPFTNVTLKNFTVHLMITDANKQPVPTLPDGTPSVQVKPDAFICFDDIGPCDPDHRNGPSCASREVVLLSSGALEGKYLLFLIYCFEASFTQLGLPTFELELVKS